jgi:hypothetical protein
VECCNPIIISVFTPEDIYQAREEARECWRQICEEEQSDLQQGAFIGALKAKPETPEEVAGAKVFAHKCLGVFRRLFVISLENALPFDEQLAHLSLGHIVPVLVHDAQLANIGRLADDPDPTMCMSSKGTRVPMPKYALA